jgi:hypothetical protein
VFGVRDVPKMSAAARPMADQPASPASAVGTTPRDTPSILPIAAAAGAATIDPANGASSRAAPKTNVRDGATEKTADGQPSQLAANDPPPQPAAKADVTRPPRQTTPALATPVAISVATAAAVMATLPGAGADHGPTASAMATLPGMTP